MSNKQHFWIPDSEVERLEKTPTGRNKPRDISYAEHGKKLSASLSKIVDITNEFQNIDSLREIDTIIYEVSLPEGKKIKDQDKLFKSNGMSVKAVKTENEAIVASTKSQFNELRDRVNKYSQNGRNKTYFDYVESFKPFTGSDKNSLKLQNELKINNLPTKIDINLMLVPNLNEGEYASIINLLLKKIKDDGGEVINNEYRLSDSTPLVRALIPSSTIVNYEKDSAIYRIEETDFFNLISSDVNIDNNILFNLADNIDINDLEVVAILDSGIKFPNNLSSLVIDTWRAEDIDYVDYDHGTKVASCVAFGYIDKRVNNIKSLVPRARLIDCQIMDGTVSLDVLIKRIQNAVKTFYNQCRIFNLSVNAGNPIEGNRMSILGYEIDVLQKKYKVQFIISAGNHYLWNHEDNLINIIDDDDSRIASPADALMGVTVGSVVNHHSSCKLTKFNDIASYSRRGPGFNGFIKPDLVAYSSEIDKKTYKVIQDESMLIINHKGTLSVDAGTSFSAPMVSGDLAEILSKTPERDVQLAKALLLHNATPFWDVENIDEDQLSFAQNLYGRGIPSVQDSIYSSEHTVTFLRTGLLNKRTKERVRIYMPEILAAKSGRNTARVTVTCVTLPEVDQSKGTEYLGAYVRASLKKKGNNKNSLNRVQPDFKQGRSNWDTIQQFSKPFSKFNSGDWQIWLELFSRWEFQDDDVEYALVVTIEDTSHSLDIYNEILVQNRYRPISEVRVRV